MIKMLRPFLAKLSNREKIAVSIGVGFIGIFILVAGGCFPVYGCQGKASAKPGISYQKL